MSGYLIRPATGGDAAMCNAWRRAPHVAEFWDDERVFEAHDLADRRVARWIVEREGQPFAYLQDYDVHGWGAEHPFWHLPAGSRGIDALIGPEGMSGRGHGPRFIAQHMATLFAKGASAIGIDPHPDNVRAIAAYRKAGFEIAGPPVETRWGLAQRMEAWSVSWRGVPGLRGLRGGGGGG